MVYGVNNYPMYSYMGYTPATFSGAEPYSNAFWFLNEPKKTSQQTTTSKKNVQKENSQPKNTFTIRNRVNQNAVQENKNSRKKITLFCKFSIKVKQSLYIS